MAAARVQSQRSHFHTRPPNKSKWNVPYEEQNWRSWDDVQRENKENEDIPNGGNEKGKTKKPKKPKWNVPYEKQNWRFWEDVQKEREEENEDNRNEKDHEHQENVDWNSFVHDSPNNEKMIEEMVSIADDALDLMDERDRVEQLSTQMERMNAHSDRMAENWKKEEWKGSIHVHT